MNRLMGFETLSGIDWHSLELELLSFLFHLLQFSKLGFVESDFSLNWVFNNLGSDKAVMDSSSNLGFGLGLRLGLRIGSSHLDRLNWVGIGVEEDRLRLLLNVCLLMLIGIHLLSSISISHSFGFAEFEAHNSDCGGTNDQTISELLIVSHSLSMTLFFFFFSQLLFIAI